MTFRTYLAVLPLVVACATSGGVASRELVEARAYYHRAVTGPASQVAAESVLSSKRALELAEDEKPNSAMERHMAYVAKKRAELAMLKAARIAAERDATRLRAELQTRANDPNRVAVHVRVDTTTTQPAPAPQPAPSAAESERAAKEASERAALSSQLEINRKEIERLDRELGETRQQLMARTNQADDESKRLKERGAALQAQIDVLRSERDKADRDRTQAEKERDQAFATLRGFASVNENDERGLVITMPAEIMFRSGSSKLLPRAKEKLDDVASALQKLGEPQTFVIEGHTDSRGSAMFNQRLSKLRADAVRFYLIQQGVSRDRIIARGRGEDDPVASNGSPEGRANNRRVELVVSPSVVGGR